jgi:hypothetical protein
MKKLSSVPVHRRHDVRVTIDPTWKPVAWQHADTGTVFLTKGPAAWVRFDGETALQVVAVKGLLVL